MQGIADVPATTPAAAPAYRGEAELVTSLRNGDERAFATLVGCYHTMLVNLALPIVGDTAVAEEVAQETWLEVVRGIHRFEGRSALKTWLCAILMNRARSRAMREARCMPFSALQGAEGAPGDSGVAPERFDEAGWWASSAATPRPWPLSPEEQVLSSEAQSSVAAAIAALPPMQRRVITLRDVQGWSSAEVCSVLGLSETNQRVLLHRARSRVRGALEPYFDEGRRPADRPERS